MSRKFFRRSDSGEWQEMSGEEYLAFVRDPANKNRYFLDMGNVVLECDEAAYRQYQTEKDHSRYINTGKAETISLDVLLELPDKLVLEIFSDERETEEKYFDRLLLDALRIALKELSKEEYALIFAIYLSENRKTERQLAKQYGISQCAVNKRKKAVLKRLRTAIEKFSS